MTNLSWNLGPFREQYPNPLSCLSARPGIRSEVGPEALKGSANIRPELVETRNSQGQGR